jgi:hypothetical protein
MNKQEKITHKPLIVNYMEQMSDKLNLPTSQKLIFKTLLKIITFLILFNFS